MLAAGAHAKEGIRPPSGSEVKRNIQKQKVSISRHLLASNFLLRKEGDSNPRYPNRVRQFSKLVVSATHPSFLTDLPKRVVQM